MKLDHSLFLRLCMRRTSNICLEPLRAPLSGQVRIHQKRLLSEPQTVHTGGFATENMRLAFVQAWGVQPAWSFHFIPTSRYLELAGAAVLDERRERCQLQLGVRLQHVTDQVGHLGDIVTETLAHADPDRVTGHFLHFFAESLDGAERSDKPGQEQERRASR